MIRRVSRQERGGATALGGGESSCGACVAPRIGLRRNDSERGRSRGAGALVGELRALPSKPHILPMTSPPFHHTEVGCPFPLVPCGRVTARRIATGGLHG